MNFDENDLRFFYGYAFRCYTNEKVDTWMNGAGMTLDGLGYLLPKPVSLAGKD